MDSKKWIMFVHAPDVTVSIYAEAIIVSNVPFLVTRHCSLLFSVLGIYIGSRNLNKDQAQQSFCPPDHEQ